MISRTALTHTSCSSLYSAANGSLERVLKTKLTVRRHNVTNKITDTKLTGEQSAVTATAQRTRTHTSGFSPLLKITHLHWKITTVTLPDFHLSNTDKN